jgi:hypothetical protein
MNRLVWCSTPLLLVPLAWSHEGGSEVSRGSAPRVDRLFHAVDEPYYGYGSIVVFREGVVHFTAGGEWIGFDESGAPRVTAAETVSIAMRSTAGVGLVREGSRWRVALLSDATAADEVVPFDADGARPGRHLAGVLQLSGELLVERDPEHGGWHLELASRESEEAFAFVYRPDGGSEGGVASFAATCSSGECDFGSCSITCNPPYLCQSGCIGGRPHCDCVLLVPPQPLPPPLPRTLLTLGRTGAGR